MDDLGTTSGASGEPVPEQLRALFNHPDDVRVQVLPGRVTFEAPGDFDLDVERRDWDDTYPPDLGA